MAPSPPEYTPAGKSLFISWGKVKGRLLYSLSAAQQLVSILIDCITHTGLLYYTVALLYVIFWMMTLATKKITRCMTLIAINFSPRSQEPGRVASHGVIHRIGG